MINFVFCLDNSITKSISKPDEIYKLREIDENLEDDRSQKVNI